MVYDRDAPGNSHVVSATRSLIDYTYTAQFPVLSENDIARMKKMLVHFHAYKIVIIKNGSCNPPHFHIPKLHTLPHLMDNTHQSGTPDNFSTETPESLHIENCKDPWRASNRRDVDEQILNFLTIREKISLCASYKSWKLSGGQIHSPLVHSFHLGGDIIWSNSQGWCCDRPAHHDQIGQGPSHSCRWHWRALPTTAWHRYYIPHLSMASIQSGWSWHFTFPPCKMSISSWEDTWSVCFPWPVANNALIHTPLQSMVWGRICYNHMQTVPWQPSLKIFAHFCFD